MEPRRPELTSQIGVPNPAYKVLQEYLQARASFTRKELEFIRTMFTPKSLRSGEFLQRAGEVARYSAFVAEGCLRSYAVDSKGKEHIVQFAPETWWLADVHSLVDGAPAQYFFDAIEDSVVLLLAPSCQEKLVETVPGYAEAYRNGLRKHAAAKDARIVRSMSASAEERYLDFLKTYPSIATRVPQWMLASYLGVTPETVSRIRRKLSRKC
jgi:CRP-like cAMP-binding protein